MNHIKAIDEILESGQKRLETGEQVTFSDLGLSSAVYTAYRRSLRADKPFLDFDDFLLDADDVEPITEELWRFGVFNFTISAKQTDILEILDAFQGVGVDLIGLTTIRRETYTLTEETFEDVPAFRMIVRPRRRGNHE